MAPLISIVDIAAYSGQPVALAGWVASKTE
jgi:hypothetical protein